MEGVDGKALVAESAGTFGLVLGGCGAAVLASDFGVGANGTSLGIGFLGVSLAFGLAVFTGAYALGHISGGHFNPAVTLGLIVGGRFAPKAAVGYIVAQVAGGTFGALVLYGVASGVEGWEPGTFASNGYDEWSPGGYDLGAVLLVEVVLTAGFLIVICGVTAQQAAPVIAPAAIGMSLTLIHLVSIPVSNTSVNPARSTAVAVFAGGDQLAQLWAFWVAPIVGGVIGAAVYRYLLGGAEDAVAT